MRMCGQKPVLAGLFALSLTFGLVGSGCAAMHRPETEEVVVRVHQAKAAEAQYARQLENRLKELLTAIYPPQAVKVQVYVQLDFDRSWQTEQLVPEEQRLLEQHSSSLTRDGKEERQSSDEQKFQPAYGQNTVVYHPGRILQLGIVVLLDQKYLGGLDPRELEERLFKLLATASPYREERGDRLLIQIVPLREEGARE